MAKRRRALILVNHRYHDAEVQERVLPGLDASSKLQAIERLKDILEEPKIGGFAAEFLVDRPSYELRQAVEAFFTESQPDDIILLVFSGQGIKGRDGMLYFLTIDTKLDLLRSTALSAGFINEVMSMSSSVEKMMILDCRYIGPFAKQEVCKGDTDVVAGEYFSGQGKVVMSAPCNMIRSNLKGSEMTGAPEDHCIDSAFVDHLTYGLQSGRADIDRDGRISADDIYEYLSQFMKPEIWQDPSIKGDLFLADAPEAATDKAHQGIKADDWQQDSIKHVKRYPRLDCPDRVQMGERFCLSVLLEREEPSPGAYGIIIVDHGKTESPPELTVLLSARGFDVEGSDRTIMKVFPAQTSELNFFLVARSPGEHQIRVDFYQFGRRIGTVRRNVLICEEPTEIPVKQPDQIAELEAKYKPEISPPDLELSIELESRDGNNILYFRLHSYKEDVGYHHARLGSVTIQRSPQEKMQSVYEEMSRIARHGKTEDEQRDAEQRMENIGMQLWDELVPGELKEAYWRLRKQVVSLLITSDEPWIPWEMVKPYRFNENNEREEDPFWCNQFALSRWLSGPCPIDELPKGVARPVAPEVLDLDNVKEEVAFIEQLSSLDPGIRGQTSITSLAKLRALLERDSFSILHFATHGEFDPGDPNNSPLMLSDGRLRPTDVLVRFGGRRPRPLVFINACKGAQMDFSFTGLGGWARHLINQARVGVFAGAMWEVDDGLALEFAKCFYTSLLRDRETFAQAFRNAREMVRSSDPSNSTWLAYVLYADPEGRVKERASAA